MNLIDELMEEVLEIFIEIADYRFPIIEPPQESYFINYESSKHDYDSLVVFDSSPLTLYGKMDNVFEDNVKLKEVIGKIKILVYCDGYANSDLRLIDLYSYMM